jgi:hypothetical protein
MARIVYQYLNNHELRDKAEDAPIPASGNMIERNGQQWVVDTVTTINNHTVSGTSTEYLVNLEPPGTP